MDVVFITTTSEKLDSVPVVDGQIIALSDVDAYLYDQGGVRRAASQHNVVETLPSVGIQGSTYIVTTGDGTHPSGMYVWANDNWIDVLRLDVPVCFIDLGDITSEDGWTMSGDVSDPLRTVITFEAKNTLSEGEILEIVQAVEENKLIVFNFSIGADAYHDYSVIGRLSTGEVIIGSGIMHVVDSDSVEYNYTVALPLNNNTPVVFVRTTNLTELISEYTFDGLSTESKRILYAINELNDRNDVMYVTATLADENGNATLDKTFEEIKAHIDAGGTAIAKVTTSDVATICINNAASPVLQIVEHTFSYQLPENVIFVPLDGMENGTDGIDMIQFNWMKEYRAAIDESASGTFTERGTQYMSFTLTVTEDSATMSGYFSENLSTGYYVTESEIQELETTNKTLVGAINELNEKEDYKIIKMVGYSTDDINQIAIDVSSLGGVSEYESNIGPNVALYIGTGISPAMLYYSDYQTISTFVDIGFHTFVGYRRAGHGTEYTDLVEVQLEGEITESNTAWPENLRGKGYVTGRLTTIPLLTTSDSYDDLETTNKQIIEAINEVNTKAESAATSSNSLVIPIAAEVPESGIDYMLSKTTLAVYDSSYTSKFIDQKMTETTEVYVELMMSKTGNSIILPLSQNTTNTRRLPNSASTQVAGPTADIEYKNGPKLYFEKTLCDEDNYLGLCIELTLNEEDEEEVPTVVGYAFDATQINEDLEKDILLNMSDLSAPTSDDLGFVHGRTHYTKYDYVSTFINYSDLGDKYTSQGFYKRQINSSIQDFVEVGKCYQITINADDKTISLIGTGVAGSEEFEGYNVIGCESVAKLRETGEVDGNSAFALWQDSELGWCIGWRNANTILNKIDELMEGGYIDSVYVSVSEVTETVVKLDSKYLPEDEIKEWTKDTVNSMIVELTQEEYDNLTEEEKNNGTIYMITDEVSTEAAVVDIVKDSVIQVSQDEYDVLTEEQKASKVYIVQDASVDETAVRTIVSDMHVHLTQDEYDALSEEEKNNGNIYMIDNEVDYEEVLYQIGLAQGFSGDKSTFLKAFNDSVNLSKTDGAGYHNSIYRGKYLGTAVTDEQWAAIKAGTFEDLYIGDYWTIGGINYRIAAFDYYYKTGDASCTTHHVVIVPDTNMYTHCMNDTNVTTGAYISSKMYTEGLDSAKTTINSAFGSAHILSHRQYLQNATTSGYASAGIWYDSTVELMTEQNVYGCKILGNCINGTAFPNNYTVDKSQYPLFAHRPDMISNRQWFWLRDVASAATFCYVYNGGIAYNGNASVARGVRPAFSIC